MSRLKDIYEKEIRPSLVKEFGYKNEMEVPRLTKIVLNMGVGEATADHKALEGRRERMYEFLDRLITTALPRVRDFRGISGKNFDKHGNFSMGLKEQIVFLEINYDMVDKIRGMDITICTTAKTDKEAKALLSGFQMPFAK